MTDPTQQEELLTRQRAEEARQRRENLEGLARVVDLPDFQRYFLDGYLAAQEAETLEKFKTAPAGELEAWRNQWLYLQTLREDLRGKPAEYQRLLETTKEVAGASV